MTGERIGHYRVTGKLGEGGMGVVYRAEDLRLEREVALKFLPVETMDEARRRRFLEEARAAARVQHPNICPVYEVGEEEGRIYFAMACVEGETVSARVKRKGRLGAEEALRICEQVAAGLEAAHARGVVHRDVKSGNVMVDATGHAWVLDFGVARREGAEDVTQTAGAVGTPAYMSPEQARGEVVDRRSDVWSLGVVLYEMVTGRMPFEGPSAYVVLNAIVREKAAAAEMEAGVAEVIGRALEKSVEKRYQSAAEMAAALRRAREGLRGGATTEVVRAVPRRRWWGWAALLFVAALAGGWMMWRRGPEMPREKQIAVLPLDVAGQDEGLRVLADGLVETMTTKLTQMDEHVIVVPASEIRSRKIGSAEAARRLYGATLAVTGSARRWGEKIELNLNVVDTARMRQVAARSFEFDESEPLRLRDGAVAGLMGLLAMRASSVGATAMASGETKVAGAWSEYLKGVGYLARYDVRGNVDRAIEALEEATRRDAGFALGWAALGDAYWKKTRVATEKKWAEMAEASIQRALRLEPRLAVAHVRLSKILTERGRWGEAVEEARRALADAPDSAEAQRALAGALAGAGQFGEAEAAYVSAVRHQPADWYGHFSLGYFYYRQARNGEARAAWEEALRLTPDNELIHRNLALLALGEGRFKEASDMLERTLKYEPGGMIYSALGVALYYQRRYEEAAAALEKGVRLNPEIYSIWGNWGTVLRHVAGKERASEEAFRKAIELGEKVLAVKPGDGNARANMAEYWAKLGEKKRALAEAGQIAVAERAGYADRLVLAYELSGERARAVETILALPAGAAVLSFTKRDPDLDGLWSEAALARVRVGR